MLVNGQKSCTNVSGLPRFSWDMPSLQSGYQLKVFADSLAKEPHWDSGMVESSGTSMEYPSQAAPLVHGRVYYVSLKTWDEHGDSRSDATFFAINRVPHAPKIVEPRNPVERDDLKVSWVSDRDPDGDDLTFFVELEGTSLDYSKSIGPVSSWNISLSPHEVPPGWFRVRVRACDEFSYSEWSAWTEFRFSSKPMPAWFVRPLDSSAAVDCVEAEWDFEADQDKGVCYVLELVSPAGDNWHMGAFSGKSARLDLSGVPEGNGFKFRITPYSSDGRAGDSTLSSPFSVLASSSFSCSASFAGAIYLGTTNGKIVSARMPYWNEELDLSSGEGFESSSSGKANRPSFSKEGLELPAPPDGYSKVDRRA